MSDSASIPGVPFNPKVVGPLDLAAGAVRRSHAWAEEHSRWLIGAATAIVLTQIIVWAQYDLVFLRVPTLPNWLLVMIGTVVFFAPIASVVGVLLGRGLYRDDTVLISVMSASEGDQRIKHVSPDRFDALRIVSQNGGERGSSFLTTVSVNGRRAYEVDSFDEENDVLVASSMAGRSNQEIRSDRISIRKIKTDMEKEVDEAVEMKANARDVIRERSAAVANWLIRTAQGATIPDGAHLYDEMQESLENVETISEMDQSPASTRNVDDPDDDPDGGGDEPEDVDEDENVAARVDIFDRAEGQNGEEAPADD